MSALRFFHGVMSAGKSTLALQVEHTWREAGRPGALLTSQDRGGTGTVTSRLGIAREALEVGAGTDLDAALLATVPDDGFVVADEAQFYAPEQVDALARAVDQRGVDVACFGLLTDFTGRLFPAAARLVELADALIPLPLPVRCWCGRAARLNARLIDGHVVREGARVVLGDTTRAAADALDPAVFGPEVRYQVLCRRHWMACETGPVSGSASAAPR